MPLLLSGWFSKTSPKAAGANQELVLLTGSYGWKALGSRQANKRYLPPTAGVAAGAFSWYLE
ncbi:hypothetical protein GCM10011405_08310 [Rufibacter glacialis]|nr:hypothetical protein GCM10011405_08310 [Rufibacter glacialis]